MQVNTTDHLIIPDDHAYPEDNFRRYEWLGNYIMEHQPAVIVKLGDSWDMASLCRYDMGKKEFMFKNIKDDIEAGHKAEELIFKNVVKYNNTRSKNKKKKYTPYILKLLGNHEYRVKKLLETEPRWEGTLSMDDFNTRLDLEETVVPFLDFSVIDNIAYAHYFVSGTMGRPFVTANSLLSKKVMSCTMGHNHGLDTSRLIKPTGEVIRGLIAGSFHDVDHSSFAGVQVDNIWWNGILHKHNVNNGDYDLEEISINRLQQKYS